MSQEERNIARWGGKILAVLLGLFGLWMVIGGIWLIALGGNWYYAIAGVLSLGSAISLWRRRPAATVWFSILFVLTLLWTIWESGTDYWGWVPRFALILIFAIAFSLLLPSLHAGLSRTVSRGLPSLLILAFVVAAGLAFAPHHVTDASDVPNQASGMPFAADTGAGNPVVSSDWTDYGGNQATERYSAATQITPDNVKDLKVAWVAQVGDVPSDTRWGVQNTPLKIGNMLYVCGYLDKVDALDPATGKKLWEYDPGVNANAVPYTPACRSLTYYDADTTGGGTATAAATPTNTAAPAAPATPATPASSAAPAACSRRIILGTLDARIIELDAQTGKPCQDFGTQGQVSLTTDMGQVYKGYVAIDSPPEVVRDTLVVGHEVIDGERAYGPAGVIKGYNVKTGALKWVWDAANPEDTTPPTKNDTYKHGSPDVWTSFTGDNKLGLVYLPVGNPSGDYYSSQRTPDELKYSPSLTALDAETGKPVWTFQNTHHDVWDYDAGSPPTLVDYPQANGAPPVPAIIFPTKNGEFYILNRATGKPLFPVVERPVAQGGIEPQARSKTQPYSTFNSVAQPELTPAKTWGLTPIDQLVCRIQYQQADYRGPFTPPRLDKPIIDYPGYNGGVDWGGVSFDPSRGLIIANYNDMPNYTLLVSRAQANKYGWKAPDVINAPQVSSKEGNGNPQEGLPVAVNVNAGWQLPFTGMLCVEPPYGGIRAIDIRNGHTVWDRPFGTARENGPFGLPTGLPINIGTPNNGGSAVTKSGLVFIGAATDDLIHAIDVKSGKTLWTAPLPAGGQAMPMVYEQDGREYVVITATGHHFMKTKKGNFVVAYALPKS